ncbi:o-succinylbenzoate synthase [Microbacterium thalassium]|uniref:o-succinylbenzoate synthase n=1 Tax=Microbacterium thalassium TaxID=362649 RepID=A0A7X0FSK8_9MICO|nr:o-succinylbenzoate synthase [Microbacterium thalassium]MBB6392948.1 O-succinylbenzoate synthase [Microbacterium thalassium]GLK22820.1 o-succinylbenzoate synthase [Microbacterium thalassium]
MSTDRTPSLPSLDDLLASARIVSLPLAVRFRGVDVREAALFEGPEGWTEFSPFLEYGDAEAATWLAAAIDFGWLPQPAPVRDLVVVNATVPAVPAASVPGVLARYDGCRTAKVKVAERGQTLADDVARVRAVREAMGPEGRVRIDANGAWNIDEAEHAVHALAEFDLEYVEQPCAGIDELAELRRRVKYMGIPIAADESVRKASDPLAVARAGAADLLVIKAQPLGGVRRALDIVAEAGLPAVVSSALDTSVGLSMGAALAASLPDLPYDCGLGTASLLGADVAEPALLPRAGRVPAQRVEADPRLLDAFASAPGRAAWWRERIARCHALLALG